MARERMSNVDTAWLRMDGPRNMMMIVGVEVFETPVGYDDMAGRLRERLLRFDRFRQKVVVDATGSWWVDDEDFRLERHLKTLRLPAPGGDAELRTLVGRLASRPLDPRHPLWQFHLVEGYGGGNAVIVRIHHCIADGVALVRVALSLTDEAAGLADEPLVPPASQARQAGAGADAPGAADGGAVGGVADDGAADDGAADDDAGLGRASGAGRGAGLDGGADGGAGADRGTAPRHEPMDFVASLFDPLMRGSVFAAEAAGTVLGASIDLDGDDLRRVLLGAGPRLVADALRIALMTEDSPTPLKGRPGGRKRVAWNALPLPLDEVKAVCKVLGVSVNDVLLSCVAGALHRYLEAGGERTHGKELRAMVPVNLRPPDEPLSLGNRFGLVPLVLPIGIPNPIERLYELRRRMDELKGGYQGPLAYALLAVLGAGPRPVQKLVLDYLGSKGSAVMTNVPGPREPIRISGRKMSQMMFWVPQSGDIGIGVSILSYAGGVQFGVIADTRVCEDPDRIIGQFQPEFERLLLTLSMLPRELVEGGSIDGQEVERRLLGQRRHGEERAPAPRRRRAAAARRRPAAQPDTVV